MPAPSWLPEGHQLRPYRREDRDRVLPLLNADRLPGQPMATASDLRAAVAGRSTVDAGWWAELTELRTEVLIDPAGQLVGVVSFAQRPRDGAGVLLWLHAREDPRLVRALVQHVLAETINCPVVHAFDFASALTRGLEALPARHRATTATELRAAGFVGTDLWRYLRRDLSDHESRTAPDGAPPGLTVSVAASVDPPGWTLTATREGSRVGEATIGTPENGIGVLWWIGVDPEHRRAGTGCALLNAALDQLRVEGAREAILYVDDDEAPGGDRDRSSANRLYDRAGFTEVDRLLSFLRIPAGSASDTAPGTAGSE